MVTSDNYLYIFLDEGGNFDFSPKGTKYFTISSVSIVRPFDFYTSLTSLKYDLIENGLNLEYFHAAEDKQHVRDKVFDIISTFLPHVSIDALIVEKSKAGPFLREVEQFYPTMLKVFLRYVCDTPNLLDYKGIIVTTDAIPVKRKRVSVEKAIKIVASEIIGPLGKQYKVLHHASKSAFALQVADYCNWAIYRKWEKGDCRSYDLIKNKVRSEFDVFRAGSTMYY